MDILISLLMEILFEIFLSIGVDAAGSAMGAGIRAILGRDKAATMRMLERVGVGITLFLMMGSLLGMISLSIQPTLLHDSTLARTANLGLAPLLIGWLLSRLGRLRESRGLARSTLECFSFGWAFSFGFILTRWLVVAGVGIDLP